MKPRSENQILTRLKAYIGMHAHIYTAPSSEVEGPLLEIVNGWLGVQESEVITTHSGYSHGLAFVPLRRIVHLRAFVPKSEDAPKKAPVKKTRKVK